MSEGRPNPFSPFWSPQQMEQRAENRFLQEAARRREAGLPEESREDPIRRMELTVSLWREELAEAARRREAGLPWDQEARRDPVEPIEPIEPIERRDPARYRYIPPTYTPTVFNEGTCSSQVGDVDPLDLEPFVDGESVIKNKVSGKCYKAQGLCHAMSVKTRDHVTRRQVSRDPMTRSIVSDEEALWICAAADGGRDLSELLIQAYETINKLMADNHTLREQLDTMRLNTMP